MAGTGAGRVVSKPAGIDCNGVRSCAATFPAGTEVSLAAMPDQLSRSATWTGPCAGPSCVVTLGRDVAVRANFGQLRYRAVDLGVLPGGSWSAGRSISANGRFIAGTWGGIEQPFFWDGAMHDLGIKQEYDASRVYHGFFHVGGRMIDIGALPGREYTFLWGVNSAGIAVGGASPQGGEIHGIVAIPDRIVDLNGLVDNTAAVIGAAEGIDDSGNIVTYAAHRAVLLVPQR